MNILTLETSTKGFSLALSKDQKVVTYRNFKSDQVLSSSIIPAIARILKQGRLSLGKLDGLAVGLGPGSFTSLRVGLATVKGLVFSLQIPVVGISSLDSVAYAIPASSPSGEADICVATDARRGLVYACFYQKKKSELVRKSDYLLVKIDEMIDRIKAKTVIAGDALSLYKDEIAKRKKGRVIFTEEKYWRPQARYLVPLALQRFEENDYDDANRLVPIYLYPDDCQVQR